MIRCRWLLLVALEARNESRGKQSNDHKAIIHTKVLDPALIKCDMRGILYRMEIVRVVTSRILIVHFHFASEVIDAKRNSLISFDFLRTNLVLLFRTLTVALDS